MARARSIRRSLAKISIIANAAAQAAADGAIYQAIFNLSNPQLDRRWALDGGGHQLPSRTATSSEEGIRRFGLRNRDIETADEIWAFVKDISR